MKTLSLCVLFIGISLFSGTAHAQLSSFAGQWKNVDANSHAISKVQIATNGVEVTIEAFGSCSPTDCPFGLTDAVPFASRVDDDIVAKASALTAAYDFGFVETRMVIHRKGRHRIAVETFDHFKDGGGRTDVHYVSTMRRLRKNEAF